MNEERFRPPKGFINYPLVQTHSPANSDHYSCLKVVLLCEIFKSGDGCTDNTTENSDRCRPWLWVDLVDQFAIPAREQKSWASFAYIFSCQLLFDSFFTSYIGRQRQNLQSQSNRRWHWCLPGLLFIQQLSISLSKSKILFHYRYVNRLQTYRVRHSFLRNL